MASKKKEYNRCINNYIDEGTRSYINLAYVVYIVLAQSGENAPELMQNFFIEVENKQYYFAGDEKEVNAENAITKDEKNELLRKLGGYISYHIDKEIDQNTTVKTFYNNMWRFISEDKLFVNEKERALALYMLLVNPRIPYFKTKNAKTITKEDFFEKMESSLVLRQKARFIIYTPYNSRVQEAMALIDLFNEINDNEERAVLLASIIRNVESRSKQIGE